MEKQKVFNGIAIDMADKGRLVVEQNTAKVAYVGDTSRLSIASKAKRDKWKKKKREKN